MQAKQGFKGKRRNKTIFGLGRAHFAKKRFGELEREKLGFYVKIKRLV